MLSSNSLLRLLFLIDLYRFVLLWIKLFIRIMAEKCVIKVRIFDKIWRLSYKQERFYVKFTLQNLVFFFP